MKCVGLISGGKDSCYNLMQCLAEGHQIVALANLKPKDKDELDSYMYQSVGHHIIDLYAEALDLPLYRREIQGTSKSTERDYMPTLDDEVEDLYQLLNEVKTKEGIKGVCVGAILSNYQRVRVENVCERLGLVSLAYLWRRDQMELLDEMIECKVEAILIKVAAIGLKPKQHLGKTLSEMRDFLHKMNQEYELNVCGEGGEYETFTLDCPLFQKRIVLDETELVIHSDDAFAPVGYLNLRQAHLEDKHLDKGLCQQDLVKNLPMKRSETLLNELFPDKSSLRCLQCEQLQYASSTDTVHERISPSIHRVRRRESEHLSFVVTNVTGVYHGDCDVTNIAKQTMDTLRTCILPLDMSSVVLVHLYVRSMKDFVAINSVYKSYFGNNPSARVCVEVNLPQDVCMMIDCYGDTDYCSRETMHVQGLSHWAPANIGPYSQCVKVGDTYCVAGQIGMVPASLSLIDGGIQAQARLSLQHVHSVLSAVCPSCVVPQIVCCVCYITHPGYIDVAKEELSRMDLECSHVYVVVPTLPKSALIEWQMIARTNLNKPIVVHRETQCGDGSLTSKAVMYSSTGPSTPRPHSLVMSIYSSCTSDLTVTKVTDMLKKYSVILLGNIDNDQDSAAASNKIPMTRIFYKYDLFHFLELKSGLENILQGPVVLVPVIQLETQDTVLTICETAMGS